jgi:hypothetical protein
MVVTNRGLVIRPGPKRLSAALALAGFSCTRILPAVTDACGVRWEPSELQVILALCGGESSGSASAFHVNADGSTDYGVLEINGRAHASYFGSQAAGNAWLWTDYLDSCEAAFEIYIAAGREFSPWNAYSGGGYKAERYQGRSWLDWASFGVGQMTAALAVLVKAGKTEAAALASIASVDDDPLTYAP